MKRIRAVGIVIKNDKVLLMHRVHYGKDYYTFPGGGVENNETVEQAVIRELFEEASIEIKIEKLLYHHIHDDYTEQFFYLCSHVSGKVELGDANELRDTLDETLDNWYDPVWYKINELPGLILYPLEIRDWLMDDFKIGFRGPVKTASIKVKDLRQS